jgi:hypothetical protein
LALILGCDKETSQRRATDYGLSLINVSALSEARVQEKSVHERLTAIGIAAGLIAAFVLTRGMTTMLVGVKAADPTT